MKNLAGRSDSDAECVSELLAAGIQIEVVEKPYGEPQTRIVGKLGGIEFRRAWYYWIASGRVPFDVAQRLYADPIGQRDVRVVGHCGCPPPEEWVHWFDGDEPVCIDPDGEEETTFKRLVAKGSLGVKDMPRFSKTTDSLQGYIETYHIDSAEGLRLFADAMRLT